MRRNVVLVAMLGFATMLFGPVLPASASQEPSSASGYGVDSSFAGYYVYIAQPAENRETGPNTCSGADGCSSATVRFEVPAVSCTTTNSGVAFGAFVGGAYPSPSTFVGIQEVCQNDGQASYSGEFEVANADATSTIVPAPGDVMVATLAVSPSKSKATLKDVTQRTSQTVTGLGATSDEIAEGVAAIGLPVSNFGKVSFRSAMEYGGTPKAEGALAQNLPATGSPIQVKTGILNSSGNGWSDTFRHS